MRLAVLSVAALALTSCGRFEDGEFPQKLSEWGLFRGPLKAFEPSEGVVPYDIATPLFSDYADKSRHIRLPKGQPARYHESAAFEMPVGTVLSKTFSFGERVIETRLLVNTRNAWVGLPYVWNREQNEALLEIAPDPVKVVHGGREFTYAIPNTNQCKGCHEHAKRVVPIGIAARHLNRGDQLAKWTQAGLLTGAPAAAQLPRNAVWNDPSTGSVEQRALAYLDANCGHCHNPEGPADTSGLFLSAGQTDPLRLGFCKVPVAAGHGAGDLRFGVVYGNPDESILVRRMNSIEPKVAMPELGRATIHREGVALVREWIASTKGSCD